MRNDDLAIRQKFNRWSILRIESKDRAFCICECGTQKSILKRTLRCGTSKSCGCYRDIRTRETHTKHGKCETKAYWCWSKIIMRCHNPKDKRFKDYGAKGITVCDEWRSSFESFYRDMGDPPSKNHSIDRISSTGNYEITNCKWATPLEQSSHISTNRIFTIGNETTHISEWCRRKNINLSTVRARLKKGMNIEEALNELVQERSPRTSLP